MIEVDLKGKLQSQKQQNTKDHLFALKKAALIKRSSMVLLHTGLLFYEYGILMTLAINSAVKVYRFCCNIRPVFIFHNRRSEFMPMHAILAMLSLCQ